MARSIDVNIKHLATVLKRAAEHRGTSFVEVYQNCNVFNDGAFDYATDARPRPTHVLELEHGKPLIFGKNRDKGIRLNGMQSRESSSWARASAKTICCSTTKRCREPSLAYLLSRMRYPEFPEPIGVFRDVERPIYDGQVNAQIAEAQAKRGEGDLATLFNAGDTWTVE